jgi:tellurite methyltransferase
MSRRAEQWDARYRSESYPAGTEPASLLREVLLILPRGRALDLACGAGRNAVFLASYGWSVVGVDSSRAALGRANALARRRRVELQWGRSLGAEVSARPGVVLLEADLEHSSLPASQFDLVSCFHYLQRSLFSPIEHALRPGGMLIYESYTTDQLAFARGPHNPDHLLRPGELREAFSNLKLLFYREVRAGKGIASLVARRR